MTHDYINDRISTEEKAKRYDDIYNNVNRHLMDFAKRRDKAQSEGDGSSRALSEISENVCDTYLRILQLLEGAHYTQENEN